MLAPLALVSFAVSLAAGRLSERVPLRGALVAGMAMTAAGLLLRAGHRRGGVLARPAPRTGVTGVGVGLANPLGRSPTSACCRPRRAASPRRSTTRRARSGSRSGSPCSARCCRAASPTASRQRTDGLGAARGAVTDRIADGDLAAATQLAPAAARDSLRATYDAAFASGLKRGPADLGWARAGRASPRRSCWCARATSGSPA